jgi:hypothetical protein
MWIPLQNPSFWRNYARFEKFVELDQKDTL